MCRWLIIGAVASFFLSGLATAESRATANSVHVLHAGYDYYKDDVLRVGSTITLVRGNGVIAVSDPGMIIDRALLINSLAKENVQLVDVTHVFVSHHHIDHTLHLGLFPNAEVIDYGNIYKNDVWLEHSGDYEIAKGIRVLATPGHTHEDASLLVTTAKGLVAITHVWWHDDMTPQIDPFAEDASALISSRKKIIQNADWIIPGHGAMFKNPKK